MLHFQAHFEYLNFIKYTKSAGGCAYPRALALSLEYTSPAGPAPGYRTHSILHARAHPFAVRIGRADPARRGEAPKRLRRLPIPTGCQNKSSLPVTTEWSGDCRRCHRCRRASWGSCAAARGQVAGAPAAVAQLRPRSGRARPGLGGRRAGRPVPFVSRRAGVCLPFQIPPSASRLSSPAHPPPDTRAVPQRTAGLLD